MIDKERLRRLWHKLRPHLLECGHPICNLVDHRGKTELIEHVLALVARLKIIFEKLRKTKQIIVELIFGEIALQHPYHFVKADIFP